MKLPFIGRDDKHRHVNDGIFSSPPQKGTTLQSTPFYSLTEAQRKRLLKKSAEKFTRDFGGAIKQLANE